MRFLNGLQKRFCLQLGVASPGFRFRLPISSASHVRRPRDKPPIQLATNQNRVTYLCAIALGSRLNLVLYSICGSASLRPVATPRTIAQAVMRREDKLQWLWSAATLHIGRLALVPNPCRYIERSKWACCTKVCASWQAHYRFYIKILVNELST